MSSPGSLLLLRLRPRVAIADPAETDASIQTLMDREVAPRFELIMERAPRVANVDVLRGLSGVSAAPP